MNVFSEYLDWHYFYIWPKLLILWRNLTLFPIFYFSIPLHLSTFFAPWKRQRVVMKPGFRLDDFLSVIGFNLISRVLGAIVRSITILYGLLFIPVLTIIGGILALAWVIIPGVTIPFYLRREISNEDRTQLLLKKAKNNLKSLVFLVFKTNEGNFVLTRLGFRWKKMIEMFSKNQDDGNFDMFTKYLKEKNKSVTKIAHLLEAVAYTYQPLNKSLSQCQITSDDVYQTAIWYEKLAARKEESLLLDLTKIKSLPGIGIDWAYGYTVAFDKYARDLTKQKTIFPFLVGREKEIDQMQRILIKTEGNNILISGEPGTARHLLVNTLAYRTLTGNCLPELSHKRILSLDMHALTSAQPTTLEVKGLASEILEEAETAGNIIVLIDEINKYVVSNAEGVDLTDVFAKFAESAVGLIGITTPTFFHKYIEPNTTFTKLFEKIEVLPPEKETVLEELELSIVPVLERKHKILITYPAVKKTVDDADRYITATPFPGKAIELLDETAVFITTIKHKSIMHFFDVDEFLGSKLHMPIGDLKEGEKEKLVHLEEFLHRRIINQEEAIRRISAALRRARLNISNPNKPIGSFLFLGPTGVGKTETAKALAEIYFGTEVMSRFDMSQYQRQEGLERLIGSVKLGTPGELTSKLTDSPFSLILLDEIEKADKEIFNLFLTLFDEGYIADATGKQISAKNTIIIITSNAGAEYIRENINKGMMGADLQKNLLNHVQEQHIFSPEFLNRFDAVVVFSPLSEGHLREVAKLMLENFNKRLKEKEISVAVTPTLVKKLALLGFDPTFGARAMKRVIAEKIEDEVAKKLLEGSVKKGEQIEIDL